MTKTENTIRALENNRFIFQGHNFPRVNHYLKLFKLASLMIICLCNNFALADEKITIKNASFEEGSFESDKCPPCWTFKEFENGKAKWEQDGSGGHCISLENKSGKDQALITSDPINIKPYYNYCLSFRYRGDDYIPRHAMVWIDYKENNPNNGYRHFTVTANKEWNKYELEFTSPDITETHIRFILNRDSRGGNKVYFDDVELRELGPAKVNPDNIDWELTSTFLDKMDGGLYIRVSGPETCKPISSVVSLSQLVGITTAPPIVPAIDGTVTEREYQKWTSTIGPLKSFSDGGPVKDNTRVYITYTKEKLFIGWTATYYKDGLLTKTKVKKEDRDGQLFSDDSLEIMFQPPNGRLFHFIGNSAGAIYDEAYDSGDTKSNSKWNGKWEYEASVHPGEWQGELVITWSELGLNGPPKDGEEWLFDICRSSWSYPEQSKWCWMNGMQGYVSRDFMGKLIFGAGFGFHLEPLTSLIGENNCALWIPMSSEREGSLIWGLKIIDDTGKVISRKSDVLTPDRGNLYYWPFSYTLPEKKVYTLSLCVKNPVNGQTLYETTVPLKASDELIVTPKVLPFRKRILISVDTSKAREKQLSEKTVSIELTRGDKILYKNLLHSRDNNTFEESIPATDMLPGKYKIRTVLLDGKEEKLASVCDVEIPETPEWLNNKIGLEEKLLPPFTPVKVKDLNISVWNREYEFTKEGFIKQIITAGKPMLKSPVSAQLVSKGEKIKLVYGNAAIKEQSDRKVIINSTADTKNIKLDIESVVEYDGLINISFKLSPGEKPVEIDGFTLSFPFIKERTIYCDAPVSVPPVPQSTAEENWSLKRDLSAGGVSMSSVFGNFWLGDDDRGVNFNFLSDKGWVPYDRKDLINIENKRDCVQVDLNILGKTTLKEPVYGNILLAATPLRPLSPDYRRRNILQVDFRPMKIIEGEDTYPIALLKEGIKNGVNTVILHSCWATGFGRPEPYDPANLKLFMKFARENKIKVMVYVAFGYWAVNCPEIPFMDEWESDPSVQWAFSRPDMTFKTICMTKNNGGHDCFAWLLDKLIREYDIDGVYFDGTQWSDQKCLMQGYGYMDDEGKIRPTSTILEARAMFIRINNIFLSHGKESFIEHHTSGLLAAPLDSFANRHLTGEALAYRATEETAFPELCNRIENTGIQWGLPVELLCYNNKLRDRYIANTLVYGSSVRASMTGKPHSGNLNTLNKMGAIWQAFKQYDLANAQWIPYWKAQDFVKTKNPDHKLSFYKHPKNGLLLLIANLSRQSGTAEFLFDLKQLGFKSENIQLKVLNKENHPYEFNNNSLKMELKGDEFLMISMKEGCKE